ncbi:MULTISPECIES: AbrB/MazE/SpoVT family DNA-binding domain-containing protein [unclassified Sphingomonas]|uniref:AbrB/MazE/SpoVT family DNA-binding domain-containing protein n=1 Tax=unclassified Sphingomonas TaxID=196159 RepID=UPI002269FCA0|nr:MULTISPECIES: AbrB/MazE/SpoVT family DNA-binding domain-containing protein [unclassified Sphingomonas]
MNIALKIIRFGNSVGVIIPKEMLSKLRVDLGDQIVLTEQSDGFAIRPHDPAFVEAMTAAEAIMREDRDILAGLAN